MIWLDAKNRGTQIKRGIIFFRKVKFIQNRPGASTNITFVEAHRKEYNPPHGGLMKANKSGKKRKKKIGEVPTALVLTQTSDPALRNAVAFWTDATTGGESLRRQDIKRDKAN